MCASGWADDAMSHVMPVWCGMSAEKWLGGDWVIGSFSCIAAVFEIIPSEVSW